ncbi:MAG: glycosyltransferase family 2 protein [Methanobrevibacter boviskoreani]|uniref:glycosyltransferase family 2 protein n=1 Tax=Methanobrevibacter boviskoreani TaxID=1348249 RepID=UPI003D8ECCE0
MVKVSVIIPIYNVENYLEECLDSIVNQTLKDIEIICVNDGSTDNSLDIINKYAAKDDRIIVIDQENGGHAVATNRGMDLAKGKYLYLMDSDDFVKTDALEKSYKLAEEKQVDFVLFQAINYDDDNDIYYKTEQYSMERVANEVQDKIFNYKDLDGDLSFGITVTPWTKLYNRKFVEDCGARFPEGLIFEDNVFFWEVYLSANRICFLKDHLFYRRWHGNSSTRAGDQRFIDSIQGRRFIS